MPANRKKSSARTLPEESDPYAWHEGIAIGLGGLALLYFLALISYSPRDVPSWLFFSTKAGPDEAISNFIGPVGALVAGFSYFLFGAACYLIPAILIWWSVRTLWGARIFRWQSGLAFAATVLSAACLVEYLGLLETWPALYNLPKSAGGFVGYYLGDVMVASLVGTVGAFVLAVTIYAISLIAITGLHPVQFLLLIRASFREHAARRHAAREAKRDRLEEKLAEQRAERSSAEKPKRKRARKRKSDEGKEETSTGATTEGDGAEPELPLQTNLPKPKIIDASQRKKEGGKTGEEGILFDRKKSKEDGGVMACSGEFANYDLPTLKLLSQVDEASKKPTDTGALVEVQKTIIDTLETFGIHVSPGDITKGPTITRYEIYPSPGLRVNRITALEADIARATRAERINIIAPIPGKDTVGIEIANQDKILVPLRELFEDEAFHSGKCRIPLALGKDVYGRTIVGDLASMPHLLVAGATGSGKSVCINSIIASLLFRFTPDELRFIMIDPKVVEMQMYNSLPHLVVPVVTDPKKVLLALRWVINEMERRYAMFAKLGCRNFDSFNGRAREQPASSDASAEGDAAEDVAAEIPESALPDEEQIPDRLPYIVVIIDELADLMQTAPADVETAIARIAQKARAAGIHLIVATQTPRADVVTGIIKANIPSRIAFQVASKIDSRVILDAPGADRLVGKGDMLYLPPGSSQLKRSQGAFLSDEECQEVVDFCANQAKPQFETSIQESMESGGDGEEEVSDEDEEIVERCLEVIAQEKRASTSLLQRRLRLGYTRAARMIDILEQRGIIGPGDGAKPREILVDLSENIE